MAGWFSRVIKGADRSGAEPVDFALTCQCGEGVTGVRGRRMQVAACRKCGYQICVLPVSPYPRPKIRAPKKKPAKPPPLPKRRSAVEDEESVRTPPPQTKRATRSATPADRKSAAAKARRPAEQSVAPRDELSWQGPPRKLITPLRMISLGMVAVVSLAVWWVVHQRALGRAVVTFAESTKAAQSALTKSELDTAEQHYRKAVAALDLLGRDDREARQVRQQARQVEAANGLALISLFELLTESQQVQKMTGTDWQRALLTSYRGKWFLVETNGLQFASGDPPSWAFALPLVPGSEPVQLSGDLSKWAKQLGTPKPTSHFVLAGQLADIRHLGSKGWEIVLQSDSICLWTDPTLYASVGGVVDDQTRTTLKSQAELLGVAE